MAEQKSGESVTIVTEEDSGADSTSYGRLASVSACSKMPTDTTPRFILRSFPLDGLTPGRPQNHTLQPLHMLRHVPEKVVTLGTHGFRNIQISLPP